MTSAADTVVGSIYEAALDDSKWLDCMHQLGNLTGSPVSTGFWIENAGDVLIEVATTDEEIMLPYEAHYATTFPESFWSDRLSVGKMLRLADFWSDGGYEKSEYYNDFALPYDIPFGLMTVIDWAHYGVVRLCQCRTRGQGEFPAATRRLIARFLPHLRRTFAIRDHVTELRQEAKAKSKALDRLPVGVLFLDEGGLVREMNQTAQAFANAGDGFGIARGRRLRGATPAVTRKLMAEVERTCAEDGEMLDRGGAIDLPRPSGLRPYSALVCPLRSLDFDVGLSRWQAVLFIRDPEAEPEAPIDLIQRLHGLSRREAEAVWALSHGKRHREIADELAISIDTLRTYLRRAADKTGVRRQGELVRLIVGNPLLFDDQ
jgi:DNA-binding CsgD family transcriptional regulator